MFAIVICLVLLMCTFYSSINSLVIYLNFLCVQKACI